MPFHVSCRCCIVLLLAGVMLPVHSSAPLVYSADQGWRFETRNGPIQAATNTTWSEMLAAIHDVEKIVNQPVAAYRRAAGMRVSTFSPGWFHEGASKPRFDTVDVRVTRETNYAKSDYVTSDLNPGIVFAGKDVEFNAMTKFFYTNRTLPKKKLTEAEMIEINRLYRIIGKCEHQLIRLDSPADSVSDATAGETNAEGQPAARPRLLNPYIGGGLIAALVLILLLVAKMRKG